MGSKLVLALFLLLLAMAAVTGVLLAAGMQPVLLWTDALIFILLGAVVMVGVYTANSPQWRMPWQSVKRRPLGMAAAIVLVCYSVVALLDSVHLRVPLQADVAGETRFQPEVLSLFDLIGAPLRTRVETSYSAPFAVYGFVKESVDQSDGSVVRSFPRLEYAGTHLQDPPLERWPDIIGNAVLGFSIASGFMLFLFLFLAGYVAHTQSVSFFQATTLIVRAKTETPWLVMLMTFGVIVTFVVCATLLGSKYHVFGTDKVGQDVLWQTVKSIRTGLVIGTLTTLIMLPFAVLLGVMAGYFRGWIDDVIQYSYTTLNSIPSVLLIAAAVLMVQVYIDGHQENFDSAQRADLRLLFLCMILGITSWTGLCRYLRAETLKLREVDYIQAAQALGVGHLRIMSRHIVPNIMHIVLITVVLDFSGLVLAEAVLSYVGVGVDPSMDSWGNMINRARLEIAREPMVWWSLTAAFIFMFVLVLAANLFADAVRDAFDPRTRTRGG